MKQTKWIPLLLVVCLLCTLLLPGCGKTKEAISYEKSTEIQTETVPEEPEEVIYTAAELGTMELGEFEPLERPTHEAEPVLSNTFREQAVPLENSTLPRVDICFDGMTIDKDHYTDATLSITNNKATGYLDIEPQSVRIKLRGNSTAACPKLPIKIKFEDKIQLFEGSKEKTWTLLANYFDPTGIHNYIAYNLYGYLTGTQWVSDVTFVDVYVNDVYQGVYTLCDQVEVADTRINISSKIDEKEPFECDYLIEQDRRVTYDESGATEGLDWFWLNRVNVAYEIKNPEPDKEGFDETYTAYIKQYMDEAYEAVYEKDWEMIQRYIDVDSFVNGMIAEQLVKNQDCNKASVFLMKKANGKITFATFWDADLAFGSGEIGNAQTEEEGIEDNPFFAALMKVPEFRELYVTRLSEVINDARDYMLSMVTDIELQYSEELENDYNNWFLAYGVDLCNDDMKGLSYKEQVIYMEDWIKARTDYLKEKYNITE